MFVVGLDRNWLKTPFLLHRKLITSEEEIEALKRSGVREVVIDSARGVDLEAVENFPWGQAEPPVGAAAGRQSTGEAGFSIAQLQPLVAELPAAQEIHREAAAAAQSIFDGALGGAPVKIEVARKVVADLRSTIARSKEASLLLMQMRRFQNDLFTHAVNVCVLSLVVGAAEDFAVEAGALGLGALLHDVGETRIPRNLLRKRENFTESERRLVEQHPSLGALLLEKNPEIPEMAREIVLHHHERIDGSGYPAGKRGREISLVSQIVAITDAYDDMLSGRHQVRLQPIEVLRALFLQSRIGSLDRELVEKIIRCLGVYPVGSLVELSSGERAVVIAANRADSLKPTVRIVTSRTGLMQANGPILSLAEADGCGGERRIVASLDPGKERFDPMMILKLASAAPG